MAKKEQKRKIVNPKLGVRFLSVELTDSDCYTLLTSPETIASSLEVEFHPATFVQFINNGLGTRFALMRKKNGDD